MLGAQSLRQAGAAVLIVAALGACGDGGSGKSSAPSSSSPKAGPQAFLSFARSAPFGTKDFASASDEQLLGVGNVACEGLGSGLSFGRAVQVFVEGNGHPSTAEAEEFTRQAVHNLCPQYAGQVP